MFKVVKHKISSILIIFFVTHIFYACDYKNNFISEESVKNHIAANSFDSLVVEIKGFNKRGTDARNVGNYKEALNLHFQALNLAESAKDTTGLIFALNNIGTDLRRTYSNMEASSYHYLALEMSSMEEQHLKSQAVAMNGLGNIFLSLNKPLQAQSYFRRALQIEEQHQDNLGLAINYANLAETYKMNGDLYNALYYYEQSLRYNKIINSDIGEALCKRSMGLIYFENEIEDKALELLNEAFSIMEGSKDAFHLLDVEISLAETLINIGRIDDAENHVVEILSLSKSIESFDYLQRGYELLAKLHENQKQYQYSYEAKEKAFMYRDSVMAQNSEVRILELENRYKSKEASQQIELLTTENALNEKNKINQQRIFFLLILLLSAFIGFLYYRYQNGLKLSRELEKVNEIKSKFFGNISHEFRTPLTLIKGPLENWLDSDLPPELKKDACMMLRNSDQLLFLVDQLLSLSKVDSGTFHIKPRPANLSVVIKGISNFYIYIAKQKSIDYIIDIEESSHSLIDLQIVEIILTNLLSNALKFTENNGRIALIGVKKADGYEVRVSNTSSKRISNNQLDKLFDRYYTDGPSHYSSSGIGLALVKELTILYNAELSVKYNTKDEIEFKVVFPPLKMDEKSEEINNATLEVANVERFHQNPELIKYEQYTSENMIENTHEEKIIDLPLLLVVEDNNDLREYIIDCFKGICQTIEADDGAEGIAMALEQIPDVIISDIMMPNVDGLELCNTLKSDPLTNHVPIILLTALNEERDLLEGLKNKADDYIVKPFNAKMLRSKVKNLLEVRSVLSNKYRNEILIKPFDLLMEGSEDTFANTLKDVIEKEITNPEFGVDEFCKVAGMSRAQLYRKLKATVDMSVSEFIRVHRVKLASEFLKNKNLNISDVCFASGFNDASYFSKSFKEVFKVPPAQYRKQLHEEEK